MSEWQVFFCALSFFVLITGDEFCLLGISGNRYRYVEVVGPSGRSSTMANGLSQRVSMEAPNFACQTE